MYSWYTDNKSQTRKGRESKMFDSEERKFAGNTMKWVLFGLLLVFVVGTVTMMMKPTWLGLEREAVQESHQYVEGKRDALLSWSAEYEKLGVQIAKYSKNPENGDVVEGLKRQRRALLAKISKDAQLMPKGEVPESVTKLLKSSK